MAKQNCWEYTQCGREPGGKRVETHGVCPVPSMENFDGVNSGKCAGRFCWATEGSLQNMPGAKPCLEGYDDCFQCPFLAKVLDEEDRHFVVDEEHLPYDHTDTQDLIEIRVKVRQGSK